MGGLGFPELLVIGVIALLVFGPRRLPEAGKALGQAIRGFKGAFEGKENAPKEVGASPRRGACPACATPTETGAAFCHHCGAAIPGQTREGGS